MSDLITINTNCLEEAIRCAICKNPIKTKRGCDGSCQYEKEMLSKVIDAVEGLAIEHQFGEWIPCSEKLPEKDGWYFGSKVIEGVRALNIFWYEDGGFFTSGEVKAWMPLPKPYRGDEAE